MSIFITFEGPEGSGKSTQARRLYDHLTAARYPAMLTREPGGTPISEQIRTVILSATNQTMEPETEALLFAAARAQHVRETIRPALANGVIVVCDRYADSTLAYQGYGLGRGLATLQTLNAIATDGLMPDLTFYLDVPVADGLARKRSGEWNRLDARDLAFHQRVADGFAALIDQEPQRWRAINAAQPVDTVADAVWQAVHEAILRQMPETQPQRR